MAHPFGPQLRTTGRLHRRLQLPAGRHRQDRRPPSPAGGPEGDPRGDAAVDPSGSPTRRGREPGRGPDRGPTTMTRSQRRRRDVLLVLGVAVLSSLLLAVVAGNPLFYLVQAFADVMLVGYLALLVRMKQTANERRAKVHYLPAPAPAPRSCCVAAASPPRGGAARGPGRGDRECGCDGARRARGEAPRPRGDAQRVAFHDPVLGRIDPRPSGVSSSGPRSSPARLPRTWRARTKPSPRTSTSATAATCTTRRRSTPRRASRSRSCAVTRCRCPMRSASKARVPQRSGRGRERAASPHPRLPARRSARACRDAARDDGRRVRAAGDRRLSRRDHRWAPAHDRRVARGDRADPRRSHQRARRGAAARGDRKCGSRAYRLRLRAKRTRGALR